MEVRCGQCNKLFRVSDDKISGAGIKFKCTKCGAIVTITIEDFQASKLSPKTVPVPDTAVPILPTPPAPAVPEKPLQKPEPEEGFAGFNLGEDKEAAPHAAPVTATPPITVSPPPPPQTPSSSRPPLPKASPLPATAIKSATIQPQAAPEKTAAASPQPPAPAAAEVQPAPTVRPAPPVPSAASTFIQQDTVHPLVSGSTVGAAGGIGCAIPSVLMTALGFGMLSALFGGKAGNLPIFQAALTAGASLIGFGIVVGVVLSMFQAKSDRNMFGVIGVVIGAFLGAVFGAVQGLFVASGSGAIIGAAFIIGAGIGWGFKALLVSIAVVIIRRTVMTSKREAFGTALSGNQMIGVALAGVLVILGASSEVISASKMKTAKDDASKAIKDSFSSEGLQVSSSLASWDPANGDLILNVTIENTTDKEKPLWYLVADVFDAGGKVLTQAKMLGGKQMYTQRDYAVMAKRNVNVQEFKMKQMQEKDKPVPPHGAVNVELRVLEPPAGVASFVATFQPFDLMKMMRESAEENLKQKEQQEQRSQ